MTSNSESTGILLREWRQRRRMSQETLACETGLSTAYLSNLETGRLTARREDVLQLADRLEIPLRDRNHILATAGLTPLFRERPLDDPALMAVRTGIDAILAAFEPNPALVVDRHWSMLAANQALRHLVAGCDPALMRAPSNLLRLCLHPAGLAPRIINLRQWQAHLIGRVRRQIDVSGDPVLSDLLEEIRDYPEPSTRSDGPDGESKDGVAVPLRLATIDGTLSFFSTTTVFGSAVDITLAELRIESLLPADAETAAIMQLLARGAARASRPGPLAATG